MTLALVRGEPIEGMTKEELIKLALELNEVIEKMRKDHLEAINALLS